MAKNWEWAGMDELSIFGGKTNMGICDIAGNDGEAVKIDASKQPS